MALILDGTSPTGAWSMHRDLLTSFVGGTRYTTATGVNSFKDQTGNGRHLDNATTSRQPLVTTAGPNSKTCADFDGSDDYLISAVTLGSLISANDGYIVVSFIADSITMNAAASYDNNAILGTPSDYMGVVLKNNGTPAQIMTWNWDGSDDHADLASSITLATPYVIEWRHEGGNLYARLNGGTETSVASGATSMGPQLILGASTSRYGDIKVFEFATWSTVPSLATRNAIVADFMAQHVTATEARVTQSALEQFFATNPNAQVTQTALEMWSTTATVTGQAIVTQTALEMWASVAEAVLGRAKVWNGSAWNLKPVKVWSGSAWVEKPLKVWNGSTWI